MQEQGPEREAGFRAEGARAAVDLEAAASAGKTVRAFQEEANRTERRVPRPERAPQELLELEPARAALLRQRKADRRANLIPSSRIPRMHLRRHRRNLRMTPNPS